MNAFCKHLLRFLDEERRALDFNGTDEEWFRYNKISTFFNTMRTATNDIEIQIPEKDNIHYKLFNIHLTNNDFYLEEYDGTFTEATQEKFIQERKLFHHNKNYDFILLLSQADKIIAI